MNGSMNNAAFFLSTFGSLYLYVSRALKHPVSRIPASYAIVKCMENSTNTLEDVLC